MRMITFCEGDLDDDECDDEDDDEGDASSHSTNNSTKNIRFSKEREGLMRTTVKDGLGVNGEGKRTCINRDPCLRVKPTVLLLSLPLLRLVDFIFFHVNDPQQAARRENVRPPEIDMVIMGTTIGVTGSCQTAIKTFENDLQWQGYRKTRIYSSLSVMRKSHIVRQ
ncbi:hypothetical protein BDN72DRAFT_861978 [Pluteus cervinus]|uniref:Uncharacterized protein n=1 Tax=Pluteus cervinus TaxID=181527 RepID=A0ACD3ADB9_9AGAR|nr:hypothetical protein BDN72DRAFT_861978 [Pluteus cervinus]